VIKTVPKVVRVYQYSPGRRVFQGSIMLKDIPGAMAAVAAELAKCGLNLVNTSASSINGSGTAEWGFFALAEDRSPAPKELNETLANLPHVLHCDVKEGQNGLIVDSTHYPIILDSGEQAMIVRRDTFSEMFKRLRMVFGSGGRVVAYQLGEATGENVVKDLEKKLSKRVMIMNSQLLTEMMAAQGWGRLEVVDSVQDPFKAVVRLYDSFECAKTKSVEPNSSFIRGYLTGYVKALRGKSIMCTESECLAAGADYCEFLLDEVDAPDL